MVDCDPGCSANWPLLDSGGFVFDQRLCCCLEAAGLWKESSYQPDSGGRSFSWVRLLRFVGLRSSEEPPLLALLVSPVVAAVPRLNGRLKSRLVHGRVEHLDPLHPQHCALPSQTPLPVHWDYASGELMGEP